MIWNHLIYAPLFVTTPNKSPPLPQNHNSFSVSEGSSLDIVREVAFISKDSGITWTAEG